MARRRQGDLTFTQPRSTQDLRTVYWCKPHNHADIADAHRCGCYRRQPEPPPVPPEDKLPYPPHMPLYLTPNYANTQAYFDECCKQAAAELILAQRQAREAEAAQRCRERTSFWPEPGESYVEYCNRMDFDSGDEPARQHFLLPPADKLARDTIER